MKPHILKISILIFGFSCFYGKSSAQLTAERLQKSISVNYPADNSLKKFYAGLDYSIVWIQKSNISNLNTLVSSIQLADDAGLKKEDYNYTFLTQVQNGTVVLSTADDSLKTELIISKAAIDYYTDIAYGNIAPPLGYNGLDYKPSCYNIPGILATYISTKQLALLSSSLSPPLPEIIALTKRIKWMNSVITDSSFKETIITSNKTNHLNQPLVLKLYQLGILDSINKITDSTIEQKVKEAQRQFGLLADGTLRSTILHELNVPLNARLKQLKLATNYYRWLACIIKEQPVIVVNIPAAYLKVYQDNKTLLEMRMVVGKPSTPTPTLLSKVNEVILYPYWHVPFSIATKELLPSIKKDPGYIDANNYQVLNKSGKILDPYSINWQNINATNFPYIIRQSTGCDNALGLLKLNFYSPFGVYLHDTPNKNAFTLTKRFFSHGCMRMEKPMDMRHFILKNNSIAIDTLEQKGCIRNQSPVTVPVAYQIPVIVWYNPVGIDATGRILFYEDVYKKFNW